MGLERFEFLALGRNQLVERSQAIGDFLLFGFGVNVGLWLIFIISAV